MKQKQKKLTHWLSVIVVGIALGFGLQFVRAWTEPTAAPPNGNVGAPINTGAIAQTKAGGFTASSLKAGTIEGTTVKGTSQLCIGTDCRNAWPTGGTAPAPAPGPQLYSCPVIQGIYYGTCAGQTQTGSTCYHCMQDSWTTTEYCSDVACTPI